MSTYKTKAIILRENDCIEADRLFYIYSETKGKLQIIVKGGKKIQSKLISNFQPFAVSNLLLAKGKVYDRLASSQVIQNYPKIKLSLEKIFISYNLLELIDQLTKTYHPDNNIYNLLVEYFDVLENNEFNKIQLNSILNFFTLKTLSILGYLPELHHCLYCKEEIVPDGNLFNPHKGGLVCQKCQNLKSIDGTKISDNAIKILRMAINSSMDQLIQIRINQKISNEVNLIVEEYLKYHLDKPLLSKDFNKKMLV